MKSMSDDIVSLETVKAVEDSLRATIAEQAAIHIGRVDKLREDVIKAHFWIAVSIIATLVFSAAGIVLALIHH